MPSKLVQEAEELREKAEGYAGFLHDTMCASGLDPQELPVLAEYVEHLAHVLRGLVDTLDEALVPAADSSPSAHRADERLRAVRGAMDAITLLIEHAIGDLKDFANTTGR